MPDLLDCPALECWQALFGDAVSVDQREPYKRHLESCAACQERLDRAVECGDPVLSFARQVGDPTLAPLDSTLVQFVERLLEGSPSAGRQGDKETRRQGERTTD